MVLTVAQDTMHEITYLLVIMYFHIRVLSIWQDAEKGRNMKREMFLILE